MTPASAPEPHTIHAWCLRRSAGDHAQATLVSERIAEFLRVWFESRGPPAATTGEALWTRLIEGWGSQAELARGIGVGAASVCVWRQRDCIPRKRWDGIIAASARLDPPLMLTRAEFIASHQRKICGPAS